MIDDLKDFVIVYFLVFYEKSWLNSNNWSLVHLLNSFYTKLDYQFKRGAFARVHFLLFKLLNTILIMIN